MPYDWTVNFAKSLLLSGPVAFGEKHVKNGTNAPRDKVLALIGQGAVRLLFLEFADFDAGLDEGDGTIGGYLRARAAHRSMSDTWDEFKHLFQNPLYQGPGPTFMETAVAAGVRIYLADLLCKNGGSNKGVRQRDTHWAGVFNAATGDDAKGAVILVGAEHFVKFSDVDVQPLHFQCGIPLTRVFDLSEDERRNPDASVPRRDPFPPVAKIKKSYAEIWPSS